MIEFRLKVELAIMIEFSIKGENIAHAIQSGLLLTSVFCNQFWVKSDNLKIPNHKTMQFNLIKFDPLAEEFDLPPECPGGFVAYRKCLVTSLFFKFYISVEAELAKKNLAETSPLDQSAIGDIERPATEAIVSYDIATEDAVGKPMKTRV